MKRVAVLFVLFAPAAAPQSEGVSYLLLDASGKVREARWNDIGQPVPMGSLVKPLTAVAYAQGHGLRYPVHECRGEDCWLKSGHGRVGITDAIAQSCNSYFRRIAQEVLPDEVAALARRFGLPGPAADCPREALLGIGRAWRMSPIEVARSYLELAARQHEPGVAEVVRGLALAARRGTAAAIGTALRGDAALAKTGTAPCPHSPRQPGDGYVVVLYPAAAPRYVLLVQVHGVPGRGAAEQGAVLLSAMRGGP